MTHLINLAAAITAGLLLAWRKTERPRHNPRPSALDREAVCVLIVG